MKKLIVISSVIISLIILSLILFYQFPASAVENHNNIENYKHKISDDFFNELYNIGNTEIAKVYVILSDADSSQVLDTFSKLHPREYEIYQNAKTDPLGSKRTAEIDTEVLQKAIELKRSIYKEYYSKKNIELVNKYCDESEQVFVSSYSPFAIINAPKETLLGLLEDEEVLFISKFAESKSVDNNLDQANKVTRADNVLDDYDNTGAGVKIGQLERGVPVSSSDPYLNSASVTQRPGDGTTEHATMVARILVGTDHSGSTCNNGLAPDADLYSCAVPALSDFFEGIEWLLTKGVNVINICVSLPYGTPGTYDDISRWLDYIIFHHDVHIVTTAGNETVSITSPGMAYNAITVGGFDNKGYDITRLFELPSFSYYEECSADCAEKPNLVAPAVIIFDSSGTSVSAPQVSGTIAQLCSYRPELKVRQSAVGVILAASSAEKVESFGVGEKGDSFAADVCVESNPQISDKEGAGILDARWARGIVYFDNYWSYDISATDFPFEKTVDIDATQNSVIRIAIFWHKYDSLAYEQGTSQNSLTNLDLYVYSPDGSCLGSSTTLYSNFEIVQFVPQVTGDYKIDIRCSGATDEEYVGIALW